MKTICLEGVLDQYYPKPLLSRPPICRTGLFFQGAIKKVLDPASYELHELSDTAAFRELKSVIDARNWPEIEQELGAATGQLRTIAHPVYIPKCGFLRSVSLTDRAADGSLYQIAESGHGWSILTVLVKGGLGLTFSQIVKHIEVSVSGYSIVNVSGQMIVILAIAQGWLEKMPVCEFPETLLRIPIYGLNKKWCKWSRFSTRVTVHDDPNVTIHVCLSDWEEPRYKSRRYMRIYSKQETICESYDCYMMYIDDDIQALAFNINGAVVKEINNLIPDRFHSLSWYECGLVPPTDSKWYLILQEDTEQVYNQRMITIILEKTMANAIIDILELSHLPNLI